MRAVGRRQGGSCSVRRTGGTCVFVKPDEAQRLGHVGWGFKVPGTGRWEYGALENPTGKLCTAHGTRRTAHGGFIGTWHAARGSHQKMLHDMAHETYCPGRSEHPYTRYRCVNSRTADANSARAMIRTVEGRGFLSGIDPKTGTFGTRGCLDAVYDVLKAYRTHHLAPAHQAAIPHVWVATLLGWSDEPLQK
ncbi:hypothetical protein [Streptomyces beijiangensis]|uniref:Uncharacterized protein n=1 Tax=Streptomyces beijiangensis TaxID=163361 RepID=A0A939F3N4_9ACTN|nr:hypothetical protein [Streptomyces beijiangensis]MBO0511303.1 hypothetical protein [Streptomyces beijiangensis]